MTIRIPQQHGINEIHKILGNIEEVIENSKAGLSLEIQQAANANEYDRIDDINRFAKRLVSIQEEIHQEHSRLGCCAYQPNTSGRKRFDVAITDGALTHKYFVVTPALRAGWMKLNQPITVVLPDGKQFNTVPVFNRLKERGEIGGLFEKSSVKAGDVFDVEETAPSTWVISKKV
jgi:hypothetical protein